MSPPPVEDALIVISEWIASKRDIALPIDLDVDLIEGRIIDSMDFAEFLFLLEEITGRAIDIGSLEMDSFRTLRRIRSDVLV